MRHREQTGFVGTDETETDDTLGVLDLHLRKDEVRRRKEFEIASSERLRRNGDRCRGWRLSMNGELGIGIRSVAQVDTKAVRDPRVDLGEVGHPGISAFRDGVRARTEFDSEYHLRV